MNGIEILNEVTQMPEKSESMIFLYVVFAMICTAFAGMCAWMVKENVEDRYLDASDIVGVCVLSLVCIGFCVADYFLIRAVVHESHNRETIVYATIDETVPWTEINERYELIRQDGKIYQLRVKEKKSDSCSLDYCRLRGYPDGTERGAVDDGQAGFFGEGQCLRRVCEEPEGDGQGVREKDAGRV